MNDSPFILAAVKKNGLWIYSASDQLLKDREIVYNAVKQNDFALKLVLQRLETYRETLLVLGLVAPLFPKLLSAGVGLLTSAVVFTSSTIFDAIGVSELGSATISTATTAGLIASGAAFFAVKKFNDINHPEFRIDNEEITEHNLQLAI